MLVSDSVDSAVQTACEKDYDEDALCLQKAAKIVRCEMLKHSYVSDGTFAPNCQRESVPASLLALLSMILNPVNLDLTNAPSSQVALFHNCYSLMSLQVSLTQVLFDTLQPESLLCLCTLDYLCTLVLGKKDRVEHMHAIGLSISYVRVLELPTNISHGSLQLFEQEKCVCPPNLKLGVFTTAVVDNLDHNPSSTTFWILSWNRDINVSTPHC